MSDTGDVTVARLRRKLLQRDSRIAGLMRRVAALESALAMKEFEVKRIPRDVVRVVQEALCNVRMIPVLGVGKDARIMEVKMSSVAPTARNDNAQQNTNS